MFDISAETVTIVKSVTIHLTADQVSQLVHAAPTLAAIILGEEAPSNKADSLAVILDLLEQLAGVSHPPASPHTDRAAAAAGRRAGRPPGDDQRKYGNRLTAISSAWIYEQHVTNGRSCQAIAEELGCHRTTIDYRIRTYRRAHPELGLPADPQPGPRVQAAQDHTHGNDAG